MHLFSICLAVAGMGIISLSSARNHEFITLPGNSSYFQCHRGEGNCCKHAVTRNGYGIECAPVPMITNSDWYGFACAPEHLSPRDKQIFTETRYNNAACCNDSPKEITPDLQIKRCHVPIRGTYKQPNPFFSNSAFGQNRTLSTKKSSHPVLKPAKSTPQRTSPLNSSGIHSGDEPDYRGVGLRVADEDLGGNCVAFCDMVDINCESEDDDCIYRAYGCITVGPSSLDTCDVFCWFADADCHDEDCMIHCSWADDDEEDEPVDSCETTCYQPDEDCFVDNCEEHCFLDSEECLNDNSKEPLEPELLTTVQFNYTARFGCENNFGWCCDDVSTGGLGINCHQAPAIQQLAQFGQPPMYICQDPGYQHHVQYPACCHISSNNEVPGLEMRQCPGTLSSSTDTDSSSVYQETPYEEDDLEPYWSLVQTDIAKNDKIKNIARKAQSGIKIGDCECEFHCLFLTYGSRLGEIFLALCQEYETRPPGGVNNVEKNASVVAMGISQ